MNVDQRTAWRREEQFRAFMAEQGVTLDRPRVVFAFKWTKYRPDWYDPATGTYYEVIGSRQRGQSIAATLDLMAIVHPAIEFRIVQPDGTRWMPKRHRLHERLRALPHGESVLRRASADDASLKEIATALNITSSFLSHLIGGNYSPQPWLADRLLAYGQRSEIPTHRGPLPQSKQPGGKRHVCEFYCFDILELYSMGAGTSRISKLLRIHVRTAQMILRHHRITLARRGTGTGKRYEQAVATARPNPLSAMGG